MGKGFLLAGRESGEYEHDRHVAMVISYHSLIKDR